MTLYFAIGIHTPAEKIAAVPEVAARRSPKLQGWKLIRVLRAAWAGAVGFELVYDDKSLDNTRRRGPFGYLAQPHPAPPCREGRGWCASRTTPPLAPF